MRPFRCPPVILALFLLGCSHVERPGGAAPTTASTSTEPHPWTHLHFDNDPAQFHFAIVGDRTGRHRDGVFEKGLAKLNLLRPDFVMSVGDLIEGYTKDEAEIDQEWDEIQRFTSRLDAPFFYVPGNHDLWFDVPFASERSDLDTWHRYHIRHS